MRPARLVARLSSAPTPAQGDGKDDATDEQDNAADPCGFGQAVRPPLASVLVLRDDPQDDRGGRAEEPANYPNHRQHGRCARLLLLWTGIAPVSGAIAAVSGAIARRWRPVARWWRPIPARTASLSRIAGRVARRLLVAVPRWWRGLVCHDSSSLPTPLTEDRSALAARLPRRQGSRQY